MSTIKFGIQLSMRHRTCSDWDEYKSVVIACEKLGYDSFWVSDHFTTGGYRFEGWTILSALSQITDKMELATSVLCNNFRNPALLAKMGATLDVISKGRFDLGIGACWHKDEYEAYGYGNFPSPRVRVEMLKEAVEIIKKMWTEDKVSFEGKYYTIKNATCEPKPVQKPHPPVVIGGGGEKFTLKVVAACADMWNHGGSVEQYKHKLSVLDKYCKKIDREPKEIEKSYFSILEVYPDENELLEDMKKVYGTINLGERQVRDLSFDEWLNDLQSRSIIGTPETCIKRIHEYMSLGVTHFFFRAVRSMPNLKKRRKSLRVLSEDVISQIKSK